MKYYAFWGKADKRGMAPSDFHLLPYHCLDVAAVGQALLRERQELSSCLSSIADCHPQSLANMITYFLALHDCGKFSNSFQRLRRDIADQLQPDNGEQGRFENIRHDEAGHLLCSKKLIAKMTRLPQPLSRTQKRTLLILLQPFLWHHGKPGNSENRILDDYFSRGSIKSAEAFVDDLIDLFGIKGLTVADLEPEQARRLSWWLAGLTVLCDWIGSNTFYFPMVSEKIPLDKYWNMATEKAQKAVEQSGLSSKSTGLILPFEKLFSRPDSSKCSPRPLQKAAISANVSEGPQLYILEDIPGSGKTEAALVLVNKLMKQGAATGIYFALPTMATANAMYHRIYPIYRRLYDESAIPSLVLSHSASKMVKEFRLSVQPPSANRYHDNTDSAEAICAAWLADNRKKALLADVGVGTIDQALLAILPTKHQALRLFGLVGKVLIVDEVHACDEYVHKLLAELLRFHAQAGGSAILLSATLPVCQKEELVDAFRSGLELTDDVTSNLADSRYPLLTHVSSVGTNLQAVESSGQQQRTVRIKVLCKKEEAMCQVIASANSERCACWIRNTVSDARKVFAQIKNDHPEISISLFHARCALCDRLEAETECLTRFGPDSGSNERKGHILIATQVVEQSLDLDFDDMVTDLAPIDLMIQRSGRLCRHSRDTAGNRIDGSDQRGESTMYVHGPEFTKTPEIDWYSSVLPWAAYVYADVGRLWLTQGELETKKAIRLPDQARELIEAVYGDDSQEQIPENLSEMVNKAEGQRQADASLAVLNRINLQGGYGMLGTDTKWTDEDFAPTRLGDPTITVYLARWDGHKLRPWYTGDEKYVWARSSLNVRISVIAKTAIPDTINDTELDRCLNELPAAGRWSVLLPLKEQSDGFWTGQAENSDGQICEFWYHKQLGLITKKEHQQLEGV